MKKLHDIDEFVDIARRFGSLSPAIGLLAQIYKNETPPEATLENSAISCYVSGAISALNIMAKLGHMTNKGIRLTEAFIQDCINITNTDKQ